MLKIVYPAFLELECFIVELQVSLLCLINFLQGQKVANIIFTDYCQ